jgi:hypothetical protein
MTTIDILIACTSESSANSFLSTLMVALSVFGPAKLLTQYDGPFDILQSFRDWVGIGFDEYGNPFAGNIFAKMLMCPVCTGTWLVLPAWALLAFAGSWALTPFASLGVLVLLAEKD